MNARERTLGIATLVVVGGGALWLMLVEPAWKQVESLDEQVRTLEKAVERERSAKDSVSRLKAEREALDLRLEPPPGQGAVPWFLDYVRGLTADAGFEPTNLRFIGARPILPAGAAEAGSRRNAEPAAAAFAELGFELQAKVTLERLQSFLVKLVGSDRPVRVTSVSLLPKTGSSDLEVNLSLAALAPRGMLDERERGR